MREGIEGGLDECVGDGLTAAALAQESTKFASRRSSAANSASVSLSSSGRPARCLARSSSQSH
jgi:hypothetical protein